MGDNARSESAEGVIAAAAAAAAAAPNATDLSAAPAFSAAAGGSVRAAELAPADLELRRADAIAEPVYASIWERIRAGFKMPEIDDPLVRKWEEFYVARPEYWQRIIERGKRYLYFITEEIEHRGMPLEIALLPIIESAYNPEALSRARASGIWQFVPATGKTYGLQQNWWLDNRRDVTVATGSALDYLENLYTMFDDWQLALASYNWGEGAVQRAINRNRALGKPADYASLKVPGETRNYLPKLQAVKNLIRAPEKFGVDLPPVPDLPYFATVTTFRQIDVALAAHLADMPIDEFKRLNPAHNRPVMAGGGGEQRIMLPYGKAESFVMNLDSYVKPLVSWRPYQLKHGERLDQVAPRFGIDIDELKRVNGLTGKKRVVPGHTLLVPARGGDRMAERIPTAIFKDAPNAGPGWHRVRRGESLVAIANRYGVTAAELKQLNGLPGNSVAAGHKLRLHDGVSASAGKSRATGRARSAGKAKAGGKTRAEPRGVKKQSATPTRRR
ncbi:MAG: transglycosylase SLT domain-containing protein [Betaproteobacteria bacterium]|nr:transglycosylase SLT domain-containing protein [Betaproteobacteria bacterium]